MRASTKKLTTAAVCTAMAIVMCVFTAYLPLSVMPLYLAAFCIFLACKRGSVPYGILCALATIGVMFAMTGLSVSWFFLLFMFAPYGIIAYFIHRFTYFRLKSGIIRGVSVAAFFNLTLGFVYLVATRVVAVGLDIPITEWVNALGGYWVLALIGTVAFLPLDFIFSSLSLVVLKRIPALSGERRVKPAPPDPDLSSIAPIGSDSDKYDIFGYETTHADAADFRETPAECTLDKTDASPAGTVESAPAERSVENNDIKSDGDSADSDGDKAE